NAAFTNPGILSALIAGPPVFAAMSVQGPASTVTGFKDSVRAQYNSSDATSSFANLTFTYTDTNNVGYTAEFIDGSGVNISRCSRITATDPTTGVLGTPAQPEIWHDLRPLQNSFIGTIAGKPPPQYRKCADGDVEILGVVRTPPTTGNYNGVAWATVGTRYLPNFLRRVIAASVADGAATPMCGINPNGNLTFNFLPASLAQTDIELCARYPLDNTGVIQS